MAEVAPRDSESSKGPVRKRRRIVVSCVECHRRKQKCDRDLPCANCRSRNKASSCHYEKEAPAAGQRTASRWSGTSPPAHGSEDPSEANDELLSSMAVTLGYGQTGPSTIQFLKKIERKGPRGSGKSSQLDFGSDSTIVDEAMKGKFRGLIRQLPAKAYIDKLIQVFIDSFNWHYYFIDPQTFEAQLKEWNSLSYHTLTSLGPLGLPLELRSFPAVLFQIMATALLRLPRHGETDYDALKYAGDMTFEELAAEYSESGQAIVNLLGKQNLSLTTIQAIFLRASMLKFTARVTESWHTVAIAIRDAQELGMHTDCLDPKPKGSSMEAMRENDWLIQRRRGMYMTLVTWDINMAVILGRPCAVDFRREMASKPIDVPYPHSFSDTQVFPRNPDIDPPTPLVRSLWVSELTGPLREIQDLEAEGPTPKDYSKVDRLHEKIMELDEKKPAVLRLKNPDSRWDHLPPLKWLRESRFSVAQLHEFSLLALHRPYVFSREESRSAALTASVNMLGLLRELLQSMPQESWRNFMLFFGNFDAVVMIACIYIFFPHEHPELREAASERFEWTMGRFAAMKDRNALVKQAQGVLRAIDFKFRKAMDHAQHGSPTALVAEGTEETSPSTQTSADRLTVSTPTTSLSRTASDSISDESVRQPMYPPPPEPVDWTTPSMDGLASLAPMFPTMDLVFNDLTAMQDAGAPGLQQIGDPGAMGNLEGALWQFGGDFGDDTMWQFLNQYQPGWTRPPLD